MEAACLLMVQTAIRSNKKHAFRLIQQDIKIAINTPR
jgi:hypothetical protein